MSGGPRARKEGMYVAGLWRYPVKSLAGEALDTARLTPDGVAGDRLIHVRGPHGPLTGRTRHSLLTIPATTGADRQVRIDGHLWDSPEACRLLESHAGPGTDLVAYAGPERFDILNLLVATDGAVQAFGHDVRRLRPNLLIGGVPPQAEATWPTRALAIGDTLIGVHSMRQRCIVTSVDPDTGQADSEVYRRILRDFGGELALNCWVIRPGAVSVNDPVELVDSDARPVHIGGWVLGAPYH